GPVWGVPDCWPHVRSALMTAGYQPDPAAHREVLYGGWLTGIPDPGTAPTAGLVNHRAGMYQPDPWSIIGRLVTVLTPSADRAARAPLALAARSAEGTLHDLPQVGPPESAGSATRAPAPP